MNNQNNSSAPAKEGELSIGDTVKTLNVDWAHGENCADKFGTVERLDPDEMDGAVEVRFKDGSGIVCLPRQLTKVARGSSGADHVQGGLTEREIKELWHRNFRSEFDGDSIGFAEDIFRAILSRQQAQPAQQKTQCEEMRAAVMEALEIGLDLAQAEAADVHITYKGYKPHRHEALDKDVETIKKAIELLKGDKNGTDSTSESTA